MIHTILGKISKEQLTYTLGHEHLAMDLSSIRKETDSILGDVDVMVNELLMAKKHQLNTVVDVTNTGMGRNINKLVEISKGSKMHVVASTGFYQDLYYPDVVRDSTTEELAKHFIHELTIGIDDTNYLAGVIAELGTSHNHITKDEYKVFHGAAIASIKTGASIFTHCEQGTMAMEQIELLFSHGVSKNRILIGHTDLIDDVDYLARILNTGVSIAFDTIGKVGYVPDERRAEKLCELLELGYEDQIVLSLDITRKSYLKKNNGHGYAHMFTSFVPKLEKLNISKNIIDKLLIYNIGQLLNIEEY